MKKRTLSIIAGITLLSLFISSNNSLIGGPIGDISDIITYNYCRCKSGGCYSGNAISFRIACAKSEEPIHCNEYTGNCN